MALKPIGRAAVKAAGKVLAKYGLGESALIEQWGEIAGETWGPLTLPLHLNRRSETLTLRVAGPAALELMHQEALLVERINTYCGRRLVRRLKLIQGPIHRPAAIRARAKVLTDADEAEIARAAAGIEDAALKAALVALGRAVRAR